MMLVICSMCGVGIGVKEGPDGTSHGLCTHCESFDQARDDVEQTGDLIMPYSLTGCMYSAYRWRATANVIKRMGWTFPKGTFVVEVP